MEASIASLDIGTTTIRCVILDTKAKIIGASRTNVFIVLFIFEN